MPRFLSLFASIIGLTLSILALSCYVVASLGGDYRAVHDFLAPPAGCEAPCWQNIRPGFTDSLEAVEKLRDLPWVTDLYAIQGIVIADSYIRWKWNGSQPTIIDAKRDGRMWFHNGLVYSIELPLKLELHSIWGAFGSPAFEQTWKAPTESPQVFYSASYFNGTLEFLSTISCPPHSYQLLSAQMDVRIIEVVKPPPTIKRQTLLTCENGYR